MKLTIEKPAKGFLVYQSTDFGAQSQLYSSTTLEEALDTIRTLMQPRGRASEPEHETE